MTQGSPALRANPGLNDGIPLGFSLETCFKKKDSYPSSFGMTLLFFRKYQDSFVSQP